MNSDRYGLRVERLPPPSHYRFPRHRSCVTVSGRCHCAYDNKLSLTAPLLSAVNPKPPLAFPSRRCLDAALLPTFRTLAILPGTFSPPIRGRSRQHSTPTAVLYYPSATQTPPRAPMCDAPPDNFAPAAVSTTASTPSNLRLTAREGRLTVCGASSSTESLSLHCITRHPPFAVCPEWTPFLCPCPPPLRALRHHRPSPSFITLS